MANYKPKAPRNEVILAEVRKIAAGAKPSSPREVLLKICLDRYHRYEKALLRLNDAEGDSIQHLPTIALAQADYDAASQVAIRAAAEAAAYYHPRFTSVSASIDEKQTFVLRVPEPKANAQEWLEDCGENAVTVN